jgi:VWFA-related protein
MLFSIPASLRGPHILSFVLLIFLSPASSVLFAQEVQDDVVKVSTDLLLFPIRVRDKQGRVVAGLTEQDLSLRDDDGVTSGVYLSPGADRVALLFALDQSGSIREVVSQQRQAAVGLFNRFGERSSVAVIRFAAKPNLVSTFSRDTTAVRGAFEFSESSNQPTAIFDAAFAAVNAFRSLSRVRAERRIVILISDGLDNASTTKPNAVIDAARDERVSFYVIHLPLFSPGDHGLSVRPPSKGFRDLAEKTGGKYFLAGDAKSALNRPGQIDLSPIFDAIEQDLRSQYLLGFYLNEKANDKKRHEFSLTLPAGYEYQAGRGSFNRTQKFFVNNPQAYFQSR